LSDEYGIEPFGFGLLAFAAALRRILQTFIAEKYLLADRPNEIASAVNTNDIRIFKVGFVGEGFLIKFFEIVRLNLCHKFLHLLFFQE
jgi:hypothetical protein